MKTRSLLLLLGLFEASATLFAIEIPPPVRDFLATERAKEWSAPFFEQNRGRELAAFMATNWEQIARNFGSAAPDKNSQALFLMAAELLPPDQYIRFVSLICAEIASQRAPEELIERFLVNRTKKKGFFEVNYDRAQVKQILTQFDQLLPPSAAELRSLISDIRRGKAKETVLFWQRAEDETPAEILPE